MKNLSYILFRSPYDESASTMLIGFNMHNKRGFIDDGAHWSDDQRDEFYILVESLSEFVDTMEYSSFTYEVTKLDGLREKLGEMGIEEMEPAWWSP